MVGRSPTPASPSIVRGEIGGSPMRGTTVYESGLDKTTARIGQVALFWGALQISLTALDSYTKWDMLRTVRDSLAPGLAGVVGLRAGLLTLTMASAALVWISVRPKKAPALSLFDRLKGEAEEGEEEEEESPSLFHLVAVPVFLAIVCAGAFWGVERQYPPPTDAQRQASLQAPAQDSGPLPLLERHLIPIAGHPSPPPPANDRSGNNKVRAFMVSLLAAAWLGNRAEPDGGAQAGGTSNASRLGQSAPALSGAQRKPGLFERARHAVGDAPATSDARASSPCEKGPGAAGKDGAAGASGRPCDAGAGSDTPSTVWRFDSPGTSAK